MSQDYWTMNPEVLGIHALAAVLRVRPHGRALDDISLDVAKVLGKDAEMVPWRAVLRDAVTQHVIALDSTGWRAGPDLADVPPIIPEFEERARRLAGVSP